MALLNEELKDNTRLSIDDIDEIASWLSIQSFWCGLQFQKNIDTHLGKLTRIIPGRWSIWISPSMYASPTVIYVRTVWQEPGNTYGQDHQP